MSADCQRTKRCRNIAGNFNRLSRAHERYRQTTDRRPMTYSLKTMNVRLLLHTCNFMYTEETHRLWTHPLRYKNHRAVTPCQTSQNWHWAVKRCALLADMGTIYKYKSPGAQPATVSHRLPLIVKVRNSDHFLIISLCSELVHRFLHFRCLQVI